MISIFATGFVAEQPDLKYAGDLAILEFRVLDSRREFKEGEWHTAWESVTCVLYGDEAVKYADKLTKGREVEVVGTQKTSSWTTPNGKKYRVKYDVDRITLPYQQNRQSATSGSEHVEEVAPQAPSSTRTAPRYAAPNASAASTVAKASESRFAAVRPSQLSNQVKPAY